MAERSVFFIKCHPQGVDASNLARKFNCGFLGYPAWIKNEGWKEEIDLSTASPESMRDWLTKAVYDISRDRSVIGSAVQRKAAVSENANLIGKIKANDFLIIPQIGIGTCLIGEISAFAMEYNAELVREYLQSRPDQPDLSRASAGHIGDVIQLVRVKKWVSVPFPAIPRWISYRLLSRKTAGQIQGLKEESLNVGQAIERLFQKPIFQVSSGVTEKELAAELLHHVSPSVFEHLVCDLLRLEHHDMFWHHVGGSGDGGLDVLGVNASGEVRALVQCKWKAGDVASVAESLMDLKEKMGTTGTSVMLFLATLYEDNPGGKKVPGVTFIGRSQVAALVWKHRNKLPIAASLGIR